MFCTIIELVITIVADLKSLSEFCLQAAMLLKLLTFFVLIFLDLTANWNSIHFSQVSRVLGKLQNLFFSFNKNTVGQIKKKSCK